MHLATKMCTPGAGCTLSNTVVQSVLDSLAVAVITVFEIKVSFCAPARCKKREKDDAPYHLFMCC